MGLEFYSTGEVSCSLRSMVSTRGFWSPLRDVTEFTVATLLQYYRALYRKPLDPRSLSHDFGREQLMSSKRCIKTFARYLEHPSSRTTMLFKEWKRMFEQVSHV